MGYSGAGGKLIHEKNQKQKSRDTVPLTDLRGHGLGALEGQAQCAVPHQGRGHAQRARHAKQDRVVVHLLHPKILKKSFFY